MAYLRKHPRSPFWIAVFEKPDGKRTNRSTGTKDRREALKIAMEFEDVVRRRKTEAQVRRVLSDLHESIHGQKLGTPTVADFAVQWIERKKGETEPVTLKAYESAVREFCAHLGDRATEQLHYVTPAQVAEWRDKAAAKASPRTANNKLKIVRTFFQSAWRDGLLSDNPAAKVQALKTGEDIRRPFTLAELKVILGVASKEWRGMILAGLYTGQRLKDIASLTWANVDAERLEIRLSTSKTARRQVLPIAPPLGTYLATLAAGDDPSAPLFPSAFKIATENRDTSALSQQFHGLLVSAGLAPARQPKDKSKGVGRSGPRERNGISFHSLRHTATSWLKTAGVSEAVAMDLIGHDSAAVSQNYTHVDTKAKREALSLLPDITV